MKNGCRRFYFLIGVVGALMNPGCGSDAREYPPPYTSTGSGTTTGGGDGGGGSSACPNGLTECGGVCVNTSYDPSNCGACGTTCAESQPCFQGACYLVCTPGSVETCYSGSNETLNIGMCQAGSKVCNETGTGFGPCENEVVLKPEECDNLADDNCDGIVNDSCAYAACSALPAGSPSGYYMLDPAGQGKAFEVYCDMDLSGGGWTLVASVVNQEFFGGATCLVGCGAQSTVCNEAPFSSTLLHGDVRSMFDKDYKSEAYSNVAFKEFLFVDSNGDFATYTISASDQPSVYDWYPVGLSNYVPPGVEVHPAYSYPVKDTNVQLVSNNCQTLRLSFNVADSDSPPGACQDCSVGPAWSRLNNETCYWDDGGLTWSESAFYQTNNSTKYRLWFVR